MTDKTKGPLGVPFRIVSQVQVPPMRSRHQAFFEALDTEINKLPRGKAIELREKDIGMHVESLRHHLAKRQKQKLLPEDLRTVGRSSPDGTLCYILMPLKGDGAHD